MVFKTDYTFKVLENCLDGAASRQNVIAHNVSNINTPGFKRILLDFENNSLLNQLSLKTTQEKHIDIPSNVDYTYERDLSPGRSPDGSSITLSGKATNAALEIGDITFAFNDSAVDQNGTLEFNLTNAGIKFDLSGNKTVDMAAIASYAGETINLGGFQFEVRWGAATDGDALSVNVTDKSIKFQIGSNSNQNASLFINQMDAEQLGVNNLVVTNREGASSAITTIDSAIAAVSNERSKLGALQNKLEHTINGLGASAENLTAAESRIRDVNMAKEMMNFTKMNILQQAASAMLAQANQAPQQVLQLLR